MLRPLDAIHLDTARALGSDLAGMVTYTTTRLLRPASPWFPRPSWSRKPGEDAL